MRRNTLRTAAAWCALATVATLAVGASSAAQALTLTLDAIETGSYSPGLITTPDYTTGISYAFGSETRGYLVFDLSSVLGLGGTITAGTLLVQNRNSQNAVGPNDPLPLRVYALPYADAGNFGRHASGLTGGNFSFIGSSATPLVATHAVTALENNTVLSVPLDAAGISDLQANRSDSFYAYGLKIVKADAQEPKPLQYVFAGSAAAGNQVQLVLEITSAVPEPAAAWLMLAGLPLLAAAARKHAPGASAAQQPRRSV